MLGGARPNLHLEWLHLAGYGVYMSLDESTAEYDVRNELSSGIVFHFDRISTGVLRGRDIKHREERRSHERQGLEA